jgi:hypothetical protein
LFLLLLLLLLFSWTTTTRDGKGRAWPDLRGLGSNVRTIFFFTRCCMMLATIRTSLYCDLKV